MQHILCVGTDPSLLYTRALVIERSGALVSISDVQGCLPLLQQSTFDLLVLCHSIDPTHLRSLCSEVRGFCSSTKILLVEAHGRGYQPVTGVDGRFALEDGPHLLVAAVCHLLSASRQDVFFGPEPRAAVTSGMFFREAALQQKRTPPFVKRHPAASGER